MTDVEVARYALRTFKPAGDKFVSVGVIGSYWEGGTCSAECLAWDPTAQGLTMPGMIVNVVHNPSINAPLVVVNAYTVNTPHGLLLVDEEGKVVDRPPVHEAPSEKCHCGVYGALSLDHLEAQYPQHTRNIVAVIAAEGNTIIGPRGLRTQFARVVAYWAINSTRSAAIAANQFRGAKHFTDRSVMLDEYRLPSHLPVPDDIGENYWA